MIKSGSTEDVIAYTINLKEADEVDPYANDFTLRFNSRFDVKLTQENNPGYGESTVE